MKLDDMFPRKYASGADLDGKAITLTISRVTVEQMRPQAGAPVTDKYVIWLQKAQKGVILSKTLAYQIADVIGSKETNDWPGQRITLYPQPMKVAGRDRIAIRARAPKPENGNSPPTSLTDDNADVDLETGEVLS